MRASGNSLCRRMVWLVVLFGATVQASAVAQNTEVAGSPMPYIDRTGVHPALMVEGRPYLMLGTQMNNSSAYAGTLPAAWSVSKNLGANTVEAPVYWEALEPQEGHFDFSQMDALLLGARSHHLHLVLLWFGGWKNGSPGYTPEWVKRNPARFPLAAKRDGTPLFSLSPFGEQTLQADEHAFAAMMRHLKSADAQHTVLMVQVENETGVWGAQRDYSVAANSLFEQPVPAIVLRAMGKSDESGRWAKVFGVDANEVFYAWAIARYVEQIASAGKSINPLPLYVNAALRNPIPPGAPGSFESGGPTFDVLPLWHAVAPDLDGIEPDIYMSDDASYQAVLQQYQLPWNAFFVPETGNGEQYARYFFATLGHGAFGWSPFGMDATGYVNYPLGASRIDNETLAPFALSYRIVSPMSRELALWNQEGRVVGVAEGAKTHEQSIALPSTESVAARWNAHVWYGMPTFGSGMPASGNKNMDGEALIVELAPDEFLVTGVHCRIDFSPVATRGRGDQRMWISVEEGTYDRGRWKTLRRWNGDQTDYGLNFTSAAQVLRVRLMAY